ncbi:hypothetical protein N7540_001776 [Penicillium herquei]|nr:hypothetical protein N7540_001776 [Penicillium herquei]
MQSTFLYREPSYSSSSYSSSPGDIDFFFYAPTVYDKLYDVDPNSFPSTPEFAPEFVSEPGSYSFTSAPTTQPQYVYPGTSVYDTSMMATGFPSPAASSSGGSSYGSSFNMPEEVPMPSYPIIPGEESGPESPPAPSKPAKPFACDNCNKCFTRFADLKRHQSSVHFPVFRNCPVDHCSRKGSNGFPRQDHLVEHLRSYHHLDVPKKRALKRSAKDMA